MHALKDLSIPSRLMSMLYSIFLLMLVGYLDHQTKISYTVIYVILVVYVSNVIGGKFSYAYAIFCTVSATSAILYEEIKPLYVEIKPFNHHYGEITWIFFSNVVTNLLVSYLINKKNYIMDNLEIFTVTDALTKLSNYRGFKQKLDVAIPHIRRHHEHLAVAYIDVDHFKQVNDRFGHSKGDELLRCVGRTISACLRVDDLAARLGGDEFGIIFVSSDPESLVERIKNELDRYCSDEYNVSFSIGLVHYDGSYQATTEDIVKCADSLMYEVKRSGKNSIKCRYFQA